MFGLYILYVQIHFHHAIQTYILFSTNNLIVLIIIDKPSKGLIIQKVFTNQVDYSQKCILSIHTSTSWMLHYSLCIIHRM